MSSWISGANTHFLEADWLSGVHPEPHARRRVFSPVAAQAGSADSAIHQLAGAAVAGSVLLCAALSVTLGPVLSTPGAGAAPIMMLAEGPAGRSPADVIALDGSAESAAAVADPGVNSGDPVFFDVAVRERYPAPGDPDSLCEASARQ